MSLKSDIEKFLGTVDNATLADLYSEFSKKKKEAVRAVLNAEVKKGGSIKRISKGTYALNK